MGNYQPIEDYAVIGDLHTLALVGMNGDIDFMSFPSFDSPTVFAALLDARKGGRFRIEPRLDHIRRKQFYLPDTNVLITRCLSDHGVTEISDCMPVTSRGEHTTRLVRRVRTVRGEVDFRMTFAPRFNYARSEHTVERTREGICFSSKGPDKTALRLRAPVDLDVHNGDAIAEFRLGAGKTVDFVMEACTNDAALPGDLDAYVSDVLQDTVTYWRNWVRQSQYQGRWRETVNRSALVLKLMTSKPHGSVVAAGTFGLPEQIGGSRNWDYRYNWIRDAAFTLYSLIRLGYTEEAGAFMHWVEHRCDELGSDGSLQVMYGIDGRHDLSEEILDHLEGYRGSSPVRIGNAAYNQVQLDIYGELLDAVYLYDKYGEAIHYDMWQNLTRLVNWVCEHWHTPDEGIWEVRGGKREFLYSKLMCWVAVDRALRLAMKRSLPYNDDWIKVRSTIYRTIFTDYWDDDRKAFTQSRDGDTLDAACLIMPMVRFISPTDPRWLSTLKAIQDDLVEDSLVYRYRIGGEPVDGLEGKEGTFCMCSFWNAECLSRAGNLEQARYLLEKMLGYANHVGLYSEELGSRGEHLGNFPQAFTHLALISAAYDINRRLGE